MSANGNQFEQMLEAMLTGDPQRSERALEDLRSGGDPISPSGIERAVSTSALLLAIGQSHQAATLLESLLDHCPEQPMLLNNLAYAHVVGGRLGRAVALWERAAALAPDDTLIRSNLAHARRRNAN